jgi:hypothetical protein
MLAVSHQSADSREALEVESFAWQQRVTLEMRDHVLEDVLETTGLPLERLVAAVRPDASASEVRLNQLKYFGPVSVLTDRKARPHFPPHSERRPRRDGNREAAFSVDEAGDVGRKELATVSGAGVWSHS